MAQTTIGQPVTDRDDTPSPVHLLSRNDDPMTLALRAEGPSFGIEDLVHLNRTAAPSEHDTISLGSTDPEVFSSREQSTATKPTSNGTSYPFVGYSGKSKGKGKVGPSYPSSLSATHGSDSDNEAVQENMIVGIGDWTADDPTTTRPLKGAARARKRCKVNRRSKPKKPVIVIQHRSPNNNTAPVGDDSIPAIETIARPNGHEPQYPRRVADTIDYGLTYSGQAENSSNALCSTLVLPNDSAYIQKGKNKCSRPPRKYLRQRNGTANRDRLSLAEEGYASELDLRVDIPATFPSYKPLSRLRIRLLIGLAITMLLTISLAIFAAHYTGKTRRACTKGIVFMATVVTAILTVLAMITARRVPHEALLAGLFELITGFVLLVELDDFM